MSIAIITGASSGLGKEFALQLKSDYNVEEFWLIARRKDRLQELSNDLGCKCRIIDLDLSKQESLQEYKELLSKEKPSVEYLVNAAGYGRYGDYRIVDTELAFNMIDLNVKALVYITQETLPYLSKNSHIIQLGSASTYHPLPNLNVYAASKSFVKHYSRALYREVKSRKIGVTTVCPGWVKTEFFQRADIKEEGSESFAKPMVSARKVVKKALRDAAKNKDVSMYHWYNNLHHFLSKILPHSLLMYMWKLMQK